MFITTILYIMILHFLSLICILIYVILKFS